MHSADAVVVYVVKFATLFKLALAIICDSVCINPYHYERVVNPWIPQVINVQSQEFDDPLSFSYAINESQLFDAGYDSFISEQFRALKKFNDQERERKNAENQEPSNNSDETK